MKFFPTFAALLVTDSACKSRNSNERNVQTVIQSTSQGEDAFPEDFLTEAPNERLPCRYATLAEAPHKSELFSLAGDDYKIIRSDIIPFCLETKNKDPDFPPELNGIWWMNGNPVVETLATFANATWVPEQELFFFPPSGPGNWAWYASKAKNDLLGNGEKDGIQNHKKNIGKNFHFEYHPEDQSKPTSIQAKSQKPGGFIMPKFILDLTLINPLKDKTTKYDLTKMLGVPTTEDSNTPGADMLIRRTKILSGLIQADYRLTRIIDENGVPLKENFKAYLDSVRRWKLVYQTIYKPQR